MTALVQWAWQASALALAVALALRCAPRVNAATRYAVWWLTLAATLALPIAGTIAPPVASLLAPAGDAASAVMSATPLDDLAGPWLVLPAAPDWLVACGIGIWLGTVALGCGRLVAGVRTVRRLKQEAGPLPASVAATLRATPGRIRGAELRCSSAIDGACALGLTGRPVVVVSHRLVAALEPRALDLIVLHELMHLRRYDDWWRALQSCVLIVAGLHPAVRFISRRIDAEREAACDEAVAAQTGEPRRYAASLAAVADLLAGTRAAAGSHVLAPNAVGNGSLLARVQRLLDPRGCRHASVQVGTLLAGTAVLTGAIVGFGGARPIVAVAPPETEPALGAHATVRPLDGRPLRGGIVTWIPTTIGLDRDLAAPRTRRRAPQAVAARTAILEAGASAVTSSRVPMPSLDRLDRLDRATGQVAIAADAADLQPLPATPLPAAGAALVAIRGNDVRNREGSGDNVWVPAGASARRAGAAIGSYFSRAGKAVASHF